jgi:hypothetical protein
VGVPSLLEEEKPQAVVDLQSVEGGSLHGDEGLSPPTEKHGVDTSDVSNNQCVGLELALHHLPKL